MRNREKREEREREEKHLIKKSKKTITTKKGDRM